MDEQETIVCKSRREGHNAARTLSIMEDRCFVVGLNWDNEWIVQPIWMLIQDRFSNTVGNKCVAYSNGRVITAWLSKTSFAYEDGRPFIEWVSKIYERGLK